MNLPNQLTVARLVLAPVFVVLASFESLICSALAYIVFIAATITDYYDGKIARERNLVTNFGKLLDPLADKVLIAGAFIMLMAMPELWIPGWTVVAIIAREFLVTGARSLAASDGVVIAANKYGKLKTVLQMVFVFTFMFLVIVYRAADAWYGPPPSVIAETLAWSSLVAIVLVAGYTVYSGVQFALANWRALNLGQSV